uniref:Uncharacterized protein n=1 Tax=Bionectria ochroleuca TaxID=29856 RepID=A0A8H7KCP0_BIOOC
MAASRQSNLAKLEEHSDALCILEMKPVRRKAKKLPIAMQEAAEMAAWISTEHELGLLPSFQSDAAGNAKRRFLISQDLDEICITVAEYDDDYIRYIPNTTPSGAIAVKAQANGQRGQKRQRGQQETREQGEEDEESGPERENKQKLEEENENDGDDEHYDDEHHEDSEATDEGTNEYAQHNDESDNTLEDNGSNGLESSETTGETTDKDQGENDVPGSYDPKKRTPGFLTMRQFEPIRITEDTIGDIMVLLLSITVSLCREHKRSVEQH